MASSQSSGYVQGLEYYVGSFDHVAAQYYRDTPRFICSLQSLRYLRLRE
jgi:hypothetical protein